MPAAWRCDPCRSSGLAKVRNCAWLTPEPPKNSKPVWTRGGVFSVQCPKSVITAQSLSYIDQFRVWKEFGGESLLSMEVKTAEALAVLEGAWQMEKQRGEFEQ